MLVPPCDAAVPYDAGFGCLVVPCRAALLLHEQEASKERVRCTVVGHRRSVFSRSVCGARPAALQHSRAPRLDGFSLSCGCRSRSAALLAECSASGAADAGAASASDRGVAEAALVDP